MLPKYTGSWRDIDFLQLDTRPISPADHNGPETPLTLPGTPGPETTSASDHSGQKSSTARQRHSLPCPAASLSRSLLQGRLPGMAFLAQSGAVRKMISIPCTAGALGLCHSHCDGEHVFCCKGNPRRTSWYPVMPFHWAWDGGPGMGVFLGAHPHPWTTLFPVWSATRGPDGSSNRKVTHDFTGGNRAAFKPPP